MGCKSATLCIDLVCKSARIAIELNLSRNLVIKKIKTIKADLSRLQLQSSHVCRKTLAGTSRRGLN
jgi:transcriptional antiterminator